MQQVTTRRTLDESIHIDTAEIGSAKATLGYSPSSTYKSEPSADCRVCSTSFRFSGSEAKKYEVGNQIPGLPFKTKRSYAGYIPVTKEAHGSFYFFLWGKDAEDAGDSIVIYLQGGPGCSSLFSMTSETGPWLHTSRKGPPIPNKYSWTRDTTMLYVELPLGVGFDRGKFKYYDEEQISDQFETFLQNFFAIFYELRGKKTYVAAESYGGIYFSYILNRLYTNGNRFNVQGGMLISPSLSERSAQWDLVTYDFATKWAETLHLTAEDLSNLKMKSDACGYTDYTEINLHYPAKGRLPPYNRSGCGLAEEFLRLAPLRKPDYNPYRVTTPYFGSDSPLGDPNAEKPYKSFFDDPTLQEYIHADKIKWNICTRDIFPHGDKSGPPDQTPSIDHSILANVIEQSHAGVIILSGRQDGLLITEGLSLVMQNLTWANQQGFSTPPKKPLIDDQGRVKGTWVSERGATVAIVDNSGHTIPADDPSTGYAALLVMLGKRASLSG